MVFSWRNPLLWHAEATMENFYVFSTASPDPVQVIKQANKRVEVQTVAVRLCI